MTNNTKKLKEVQSVITSLLTVEKNQGIETIKLDNLYWDTEGERIPYRSFGYSSLSEFLKSIPEIEIRSNNGTNVIYFSGKESTEHVSKLVARQKSNSRPNRSRSCSKRIPQLYLNQPRRSTPSIQYDGISEEILDIVQRNPKGLFQSELLRIYLQRYPRSGFDGNKLSHHLKILRNDLMIREHMVIPTRNPRSVRTSTLRWHSVPRQREGNAYGRKSNNDDRESGTIANSYRVTPDSDDEDIGGFHDISFDYVTSTDKVDEEIIGCVAVETKSKKTTSDFIEKSAIQDREDKLENANSTVKTGIENHLQTQAEQKQLSEDDSNFLKCQDFMANALSGRVQFRLEKLIQNNPDGIWCVDLPNKYQEEYNVPLDWGSLDFQRVSNFAAHFPHIFHMVGPFANGDYRLYNAKDPLPTDAVSNDKKSKLTAASLYQVYDSDDDEIEALPSNISLELCNRILPDDVMTNGESVGQISVTQFKVFANELDDKSLVKVRVVESFSPSFFWIQIEKKQRKFEDMMDRLQTFYEDRKAEYIVPIIMLERGLNVACMFFGKWHRAIIKAVDPQCQVTLLFYDYGTVKTYPSTDIFYLHRSFSVLPAQAIPCGLFNVKPFDGDKWPKHVIDSFIKQVHDRVMWMAIGRIDAETNSMVISLTDTVGEKDFHISDWMFEKKKAIRGNMDIVDPEDLSNYVEDYGEVPQVSDESEVHQSQSTTLDNVLKLPPGISTVTVENLCCGLSILEKKQSVIMTTRDSIDNLQNSIQKILLGYSRMLLAMHAAVDLEKMINVTEDLAKTIIEEFHSALTTVPVNHASDTKNQSVILDTAQMNNDVLNAVENIPMQSVVSNTFEAVEEVKSNQEKSTSSSSDAEKSCVDVNPEGITEEITGSRTLEKDGGNKPSRQESTITSDNSTVEQIFNPFVDSLKDTNPFKEDILLTVLAENSRVPPPLPPRFDKEIKDNTEQAPSSFIPPDSVKIVYQASPILYNTSKNYITFKSPIKTKLRSPEMSFSKTPTKCIEGWKRSDLTAEEDDIGYQSDASSPILSCISRQNEQVIAGRGEKSHVDSQVKKKLIMNNYHCATELLMEKDFQPVQLTCSIVCIFHIRGEGWIPVDHFISTFIPFLENHGFYQFINIAMPKMAILLLKRAENSALFDRYARTMSNWKPCYQSTGKRQVFHESGELALIQLSSIMKILSRMCIITKEEIKFQREHPTLNYRPSLAMTDVIKLISTYGSVYGNYRQQYP